MSKDTEGNGRATPEVSEKAGTASVHGGVQGADSRRGRSVYGAWSTWRVAAA